jgi:hypothetical protein
MISRRSFVGSAAASLLGPAAHWAGAGIERGPGFGYGPLRPVGDESTGLPLLSLPEGFRYVSFGWHGDPMRDGVATPSLHDGMGACRLESGRVVLLRNHEQSNARGATFTERSLAYDLRCDGGVTRLEFDPGQGRCLDDRGVLSGTLRNCAGGMTPQRAWLSCEETVAGAAEGATRPHGYVFEVPATGRATARPLVALGRFRHEAVAVDPRSGIVYQTEDDPTSGFYRFVPRDPDDLAAGGRLQMLGVIGAARNASIGTHSGTLQYHDTGPGLARGATHDVRWIDVAPEALAHGSTPSLQGLQRGGSSFRRGEGCWFGEGLVYFTATTGGAASLGQVFAHDPHNETLTLLYEAADPDQLAMPDNIAMSPRGGLVLCEDAGTTPQSLKGMTRDGRIFPFCANNVDFRALRGGRYSRPGGTVFAGDYRGSELAGAVFDGEWLFLNIQSPGITVAITGPWARGPL